MNGKGENIFKRKDGRWEARYIKGYDHYGKIRYGYCYGKTYKEAKEKVTKCKSLLMAGIPIEKPKYGKLFGEYCDEWLCVEKNKFKEATYIKYHTNIEKYIKPKLGYCNSSVMTTELVSSFVDYLFEQRKLAAKTVKDILVLIHSILKYAAKKCPGQWDNIEIIYPRDEKKEMRVLSVHEQYRLSTFLLEEIDCCKCGVLLAMYTGVRIGELCALQWKDISLDNGTVKIANTMQRLRIPDSNTSQKTKIVIGTPKTRNAVRIIPLTYSLTKLCEKMKPKNEEAFLLTATDSYMEPRTLQYRFKKYAEACAIENVHFHTLRHTFATRCVEAGVEIKSLSDILGHSTTSITIERYVHSSLEFKRLNIQKLPDIELDSSSQDQVSNG